MSNHGGKRKGAGRPAIVQNEKSVSKTLTAPQTVWDTLEKMGAGNTSRGLRVMGHEMTNATIAMLDSATKLIEANRLMRDGAISSDEYWQRVGDVIDLLLKALEEA